MNYRKEIDGLRAIAVLPVIFFHAGFEMFGGGYVGVDVFFVISGYLITGILIDDLRQDRFSIARFYERRARRILPALSVVMLTCIVVAYFWTLPADLEEFSESVIAVVFFASNILFWQQEGYFATAAELKPLLHTWSLAVEEQYYVLFPLLLLGLWRFGTRPVFWTIAAIAVLSLLLSEWGWRHRPDANFYLAPSRAWELLAGSICAFLGVRARRKLHDLAGLAGLFLIGFAVFAFDAQTPFPSRFTLVPVLGTVLVILYARQGTLGATILSFRPFVWVGLISYSTYLWHQPLFAFARLRSLSDPTPLLMGGLAIAALVLGWASWRFVEQPFRRRPNPVLESRRSVFAGSALAGAALCAFGFAGLIGQGFPARFDPVALDILQTNGGVDACAFDPHSGSDLLQDGCLQDREGRFDILVYGDSHTGAFLAELTEQLRQQSTTFAAAYYMACPPLRNFRRFDQGADHQCVQFNDRIVDLATTSDAKVLVISARYALSVFGTRFDNQEGGREHGSPACLEEMHRSDCTISDAGRIRRVLDAYDNQIRSLAERFSIVIVYPIPEAGWDVPRQAGLRRIYQNDTGPVTTSLSVFEDRNRAILDVFDRIVEDLPNVRAARVHDVFCDPASGRCANSDDQGVYYHDDDHLSQTGARRVVPVILNQIQAALSEQQ